MKIISKTIFNNPIQTKPGDTAALLWGGEKVLESDITRYITITGGIIFELEEGDIEGVMDGIGGAFIQEDTCP